MTRRNFLAQSAASAAAVGLAPFGVPSAVGAGVRGANDRLAVAIVGIGQRGRDLLNDFRAVAQAENAEIVAVCDLWTRNRERAAFTVQGWEGRTVRQFRRLEDLLAAGGIDAVILATPDFQHAQQLPLIVGAGKDCYCEKPLAHDLHHGLAAVRAVKETGRVVQVGTQRRSDGRYAAAARLLATGVLGTLTQVVINWNYFGPRWRRGDVHQLNERDTDWKAFLMDRADRPFDPHQYLEWRLFRDFSSGIPDQWMSHMIDTVHWLSGAADPRAATALGGVYVWKDGRQNADTFQALLQYAQGFQVSYSTTFGNSSGSDAIFFYGTAGRFDTATWRLTGEGGGGKDRIAAPILVPVEPSASHMANWLQCIRSRNQPNAPVESGLAASVAAIMAVRAMETGRRQVWEPERLEIHAG